MNLIRRIAKGLVLGSSAPEGGEADSRGFVSFISSISIAGLALGVTALLVVTSVMNGFERELKSRLTDFHGHILLFSRRSKIPHAEEFRRKLQSDYPEIVGVSPYVFAEGMLRSSKGVSGVIIEGIHLPTLDTVSRISTRVIEGAIPEARVTESPTAGEAQIALAAEVARKLRVGVGESVLLTIPFAGPGESSLVKKFTVSGIIRLGMYDYDSKYALTEISELQALFKMNDEVNAFKILTKEASRSMATAAELNQRFVSPIRAKDWSQINMNLFRAIRLEKVVISIILMAIVLVASFNIVSTILMLVHDKKRQIAMLKAMGFAPRRVFAVFLFISTVLAALGTVLGLGLGRAVCALLSWRSIIDLPADVYLLSRIPVEIRPWEWFFICCMTIVLAAVSTLLPSYRMSREPPVEGLRYE